VPGTFTRSLAAILVALALTGCNRADQHGPSADKLPAPPVDSVVTPDEHRPARARHDLSADEAMGGHTLARHVGKTDAELLERLRREPQIASASTYPDRTTAEEVIAAALESPGRQFDAWRRRTGRRPNFVLRYAADRTIGRIVSRGRSASAPCRFALVVIRWDERRAKYYILTSYPEENR
jgi:hypothetical protein